MQAPELLSWPSFKLRPMVCPEDTPARVRHVLDMHGVPVRGVGGEYVALSEAVFLDDDPNLLAFGQSGLAGRICIAVESLEIVHVPGLRATTVNSVNSNLMTFSACVEAAISRFPYYTYETTDENEEDVVNYLRSQLLKIDRVVGAHNGFWETFFDDIAMGNYAEEEFERAPLK